MTLRDYKTPSHYDPGTVGEVWRVPYQVRFEDARRFAGE